jgi:hypothetical protein
LAVKRIAQLSEAKRMALKATDIPAASPQIDADGQAVSSSAANAPPHPGSNRASIPALNQIGRAHV